MEFIAFSHRHAGCHRGIYEGGAIELLFRVIALVGDALSISEEVLPLVVMRPFSGSGSLGMTASIIQNYGPDSFTGRLAWIMQGITKTTFYMLTVYFGTVGIRKYRYALWVRRIGDAVVFCGILYYPELP